ncbi:hypothetical protein ACWCXX_39240 [Streptomyces sp. NPDC001732]
MEIANAISACAKAREAGGERRTEALRDVSRQLAPVARGLRTAYKQRGTIPRRSPRRAALDTHARQVIAALRKAEARLDTDPNTALRDLADLLLTVADRYCEARVGALLDEAQLDSAQARSEREWLRIAVSALMLAGAAIGITALSLADSAEPVVIACACLFVLAIVWNRRIRRALDLLSIVLGP